MVGSKDLVLRLSECGVRSNKIMILPINNWYDLGLCKIKLQQVTHDVPNHCLHIEINNKKCLYVVDTSNVDNIEANGYDLYLIESNYNEEILKKHIENCEDKNMLVYLNRVEYTHLSFEQANSFLIENMGKNSEFEYIHQSKYNFDKNKIGE